MRVSAKLLAALALAASLNACHNSKKDSIDTLPVEKLYAKAHDSLVHADYAGAEKAYERLISRFPSGAYNEQSQLELAYTQYKNNKADDASATINRFIKTYPTQKHVDYAYYLRGLINFDRVGSYLDRLFDRESAQSRRDQGYNLQSFDDFSELARRFPDSAYTAEARQRMIYLRNTLAEFEVHIAAFYLRTQAYIAAADRAQYVIEHYQQAPQAGDALAILTRSYLKLDRKDLAAQTLKVLALNYPNHPYLADPQWPKNPSMIRKVVPFSGHH